MWLGLTVTKQPDDFGHVRAVFVLSFYEDVLADLDDGATWETLHADGQRAEIYRFRLLIYKADQQKTHDVWWKINFAVI